MCFPSLNNTGAIITKAMTSGKYTKGTKKYVSVSLGGSGFSAGDDILLVVF